mgnify:FL=1
MVKTMPDEIIKIGNQNLQIVVDWAKDEMRAAGIREDFIHLYTILEFLEKKHNVKLAKDEFTFTIDGGLYSYINLKYRK